MKSHCPFVSAAALALAGLFASGTPAMAGGIDDSAKDLAKIEADWSNSAATRDAALVASYYADDAIVYPPNDLLKVGRQEALKFWAAGLADPTYSISWKTSDAMIASSGELGITSGTYEESYKGTDGKRVRNTGKYVTVWAKNRDGAWKAIKDIWNPDK
ncbi:MAG TPA: DUF4440 domain-containing protein [Bryobacteraceae bacterium]|nr:DUF4440 domain-containing protein [Bryobacteraceae bacterium]